VPLFPLPRTSEGVKARILCSTASTPPWQPLLRSRGRESRAIFRVDCDQRSGQQQSLVRPLLHHTPSSLPKDKKEEPGSSEAVTRTTDPRHFLCQVFKLVVGKLSFQKKDPERGARQVAQRVRENQRVTQVADRRIEQHVGAEWEAEELGSWGAEELILLDETRVCPRRRADPMKDHGHRAQSPVGWLICASFPDQETNGESLRAKGWEGRERGTLLSSTGRSRD
jgi:hypothetical protein